MSFPYHPRSSQYSWLLLGCFLEFSAQAVHSATHVDEYLFYHRAVIEAEAVIAAEDYNKALGLYTRVFDSYDFVFLRDYKIASQLALYVGKTDDSFVYLKKGISIGWIMKSIKKNEFLRKIQRLDNWKTVKPSYDSLRSLYQAHIDLTLRKRV